MSNLNIPTVELVSTLRAAPQNGSPSSQDYNDSWTEALADLASLSGFIDEILIPMLNGLLGTILPDPNASPLGLEGRFIYSDTTDSTSVFFNNLADQSLSIADSLRVIQGTVITTQQAIATLNVEVIALQTQLSTTNQNDIAQALQNFAASLQSLTSQTQSIQSSVATFEVNGTALTLQSIVNIEAGNGITITNPSAGDILIAGPLLKHNGTSNSTQTLLNIAAGTNVSVSEVGGTLTINCTSGAGGVALQTNGSPNSTQALLDLQQGTGVTISESGGVVTISAGASISLSTNGTSNASQTALNLENGTNIKITNPSAGNVLISSPTIPIAKRWCQYQSIPGLTISSGNGEQVLLDTFTAPSANASDVAGGPTATFGPYTQYQAGTGAGGGFFNILGTAGFWSGRNPYINVIAGFNSSADFASANDSFIWLCMSDGTTGTNFRTASPTGVNLFGFLYDSALSANWIAVVGNAGTYTTTNTGVAADANPHQFEAQVNNGSTNVVFSIDGTVVATVSAVPAAVAMAVTIAVGDTAAVTTNFNVCRFYGQSDF